MPRFDAIACQRLAHILWRWRVPLLPKLLDAFVIVFWKCSLPHTVAIGKGSRIAYYQPGVVVHRRCVIGENVELHGGVVIGGRKDGVLGVPRIGNNVCIYSGAKILGDITIGDNCVIAANAVVIEDMPPGAMALPPRAQIYPRLTGELGASVALPPQIAAGLFADLAGPAH
jgi:serine O-acetyltransferase